MLRVSFIWGFVMKRGSSGIKLELEARERWSGLNDRITPGGTGIRWWRVVINKKGTGTGLTSESHSGASWGIVAGGCVGNKIKSRRHKWTGTV
ncbi:hypothetical protein Tco_1237291 [Tanacetum coccineum]